MDDATGHFLVSSYGCEIGCQDSWFDQIMINRIKINYLAASCRFLPKRHEYKAERAGHGFFQTS
jgi:hypothetical protein